MAVTPINKPPHHWLLTVKKVVGSISFMAVASTMITNALQLAPTLSIINLLLVVNILFYFLIYAVKLLMANAAANCKRLRLDACSG